MEPVRRYVCDGWSLDDRDPEVIRRWLPLWGWFYDHYFRVQSHGWEHIPPAGPALIVGSHNGGLASPDMVMGIYDWFCHFGCYRPTYGLMHPYIWQLFPPMARLATQAGAIQAHPKMAQAALRRGATVLVYPGGAQDVFRPHAQRDRIHLAGRTGFLKLAIREGVPIIPLVSWGAHETLFVVDDYYGAIGDLLKRFNLPWLFNMDPLVMPLYLGLPWGIALGPLPNWPLPHPIHLQLGEPIYFERLGRSAAQDRTYVQQCYAQVRLTMQHQLDRLIATVS